MPAPWRCGPSLVRCYPAERRFVVNVANKKELAQFLLEQIEGDLREESEPSAAVSRELMHQLCRSRLWPLHGGHRLKTIITGGGEVAATIVCHQDREDDREVTLAVRKSADQDTIEVVPGNWPAGWQPLALIAGRFRDDAPLKPAIHEDTVAQAGGTANSAARQRQPMGMEILSADDSDVIGSGRTSDAPIRFQSSDLTCRYYRREGLLEVERQSADEAEPGRVVGELRYAKQDGEPVSQRRLITPQFRDNAGWSGAANFQPSSEHLDRIVVRALTVADLDLLPPHEIQELLAHTDFAALRLHATGNGFTCRSLLPHQQQMLADPAAHWCLRVAKVDGEEDDDV